MFRGAFLTSALQLAKQLHCAPTCIGEGAAAKRRPHGPPHVEVARAPCLGLARNSNATSLL